MAREFFCAYHSLFECHEKISLTQSAGGFLGRYYHTAQENSLSIFRAGKKSYLTCLQIKLTVITQSMKPNAGKTVKMEQWQTVPNAAERYRTPPKKKKKTKKKTKEK